MSHRLRDFDAIDIVARFMRELQHKPNENTERETQTEPRALAASLGPSLALLHAPLAACERTNVRSQQLEKRRQQRRQQQQLLQVDCGAHNDS